MTAALFRRVAGTVVAATAVALPLAALLVPGRFGPVWAAALWAAGIVLSFAGWGGWLQRRLLPTADQDGGIDVGLRIGWGFCLTIAASGVLCLFGVARRPVVLAWVFAGVALAAGELYDSANRRTAAGPS